MFAHQVIEDLKKNSKMYDSKKLTHLIENIKSSQKFHFGLKHDLFKIICNRKPFEIFKGDNRKDVHPPYPKTWFDFTSDHERYSKCGIYIAQYVTDKHEMINCDCFEFNRKLSKWVAWPVNIGICLSEDAEYAYFKGIYNDKFSNHDSIKNHLKEIGREAILFAGDVNLALLFLNCKNIGTETVHAPVKLNNKRKKAGKQPIFTYKTLVIKPVGKKQESIPKHLWNNRIHLARGHFKTYTAEKPLFGKITGRFWWQPAVRGRNRDGVVMKDYEVQTS